MHVLGTKHCNVEMLPELLGVHALVAFATPDSTSMAMGPAMSAAANNGRSAFCLMGISFVLFQ